MNRWVVFFSFRLFVTRFFVVVLVSDTHKTDIMFVEAFAKLANYKQNGRIFCLLQYAATIQHALCVYFGTGIVFHSFTYAANCTKKNFFFSFYLFMLFNSLFLFVSCLIAERFLTRANVYIDGTSKIQFIFRRFISIFAHFLMQLLSVRIFPLFFCLSEE